MEFFENMNEETCSSCQCDGYCNDSPSGGSGCDDNNEGWHSGEDPK